MPGGPLSRENRLEHDLRRHVGLARHVPGGNVVVLGMERRVPGEHAGSLVHDLRDALLDWIATCLVGTSQVSSMICVTGV